MSQKPTLFLINNCFFSFHVHQKAKNMYYTLKDENLWYEQKLHQKNIENFSRKQHKLLQPTISIWKHDLQIS